ncbi:MAG: hypothetical protein P1U46_04470 [Patescibacteria group bacterium]|nr:hypothetical protein [Patescibacteria group bacterium]
MSEIVRGLTHSLLSIEVIIFPALEYFSLASSDLAHFKTGFSQLAFSGNRE